MALKPNIKKYQAGRLDYERISSFSGADSCNYTCYGFRHGELNACGSCIHTRGCSERTRAHKEKATIRVFDAIDKCRAMSLDAARSALMIDEKVRQEGLWRHLETMRLAIVTDRLTWRNKIRAMAKQLLHLWRTL